VAFRLARPGEAPSLWSRTIDRPGGRFWGKLTALLIVIVLAGGAWGGRRRRRRRAIRSGAA
jgi:quinoprotein glucose dehydrogenase